MSKNIKLLAATTVLLTSLTLVHSARRSESNLAGLTSQTTSTLALAQIETLRVIVTRTDYTDNLAITHQDDLQNRLQKRLRIAGLQTPPSNTDSSALHIPQFHIHIDTLTPADSNSVVLHVRSAVSMSVTLADRPDISLPASIRQIPPIMQSVSPVNLEAAAARCALAQADSLITVWRAARSIAETIDTPPDPNQPKTAVRTDPAPTPPKTTDAETAQPAFVASKNSTVYHLPTCRSARRISPENVVAYKTAAEAQAAGKRPCKICQP